MNVGKSALKRGDIVNVAGAGQSLKSFTTDIARREKNYKQSFRKVKLNTSRGYGRKQSSTQGEASRLSRHQPRINAHRPSRTLICSEISLALLSHKSPVN